MSKPRIELARQESAEELLENFSAAFEELQPNGWGLFVAPSKPVTREKWAVAGANLLATQRINTTWADNPGLQEKFGKEVLAAKLGDRFSNDSQLLSQVLAGMGKTSLASCLLVYAPSLYSDEGAEINPSNWQTEFNRLLPIPSRDYNPLKAFITCSVDVSSPFASIPIIPRRLVDLHRSKKYPDGNVYYTIGGGLEAGYDMSSEDYFTIASAGLDLVLLAAQQTKPRRRLTCYLGEKEVDGRMLDVLERKAGISHSGLGNADDNLFGIVTRYVVDEAA